MDERATKCVDRKNVFRKFILVQDFVVGPARTKTAGETPWHKRRVNFKPFGITGHDSAYSVSLGLEHADGQAL